MKHKVKIAGGLIVGGVALTLVLGGASDISAEKLQDKYDNAPQIKQEYQLDGATLKRSIVKNPELDVYKNEPKDEIKITLGDKDKTEFTPDIELKRWNEVFFKIKPKGLESVATKDKTLSFENDKIKFGTPKMSFEMYDYAEGEGGFKYVWFLNEKPASNIVSFDIETSGLDFFYQPPLTQEYQNGYSEEFQREIVVSETQVKDLEGNVLAERPENVVGSYAVYHSTKGGMVDAWGKAYGTGKFGHIKRIKLIDANGLEDWGKLNISDPIETLPDGTEIRSYSVKLPDDFYKNAVYPIKSNDTFGYDTAGGSNSISAANTATGSVFTSPNNVSQVDSMSIYVYVFGSDDFKLMMWLHSDETLVANSITPTINNNLGTAWHTSTYVSKPTISASTAYILGALDPTSTSYYWDAGDANQGHMDPNSFTTPTNLSTPTHNTNKYSIYATYTPSGGGEAAPAPVDDFLIIQEQ